MTRIRGLVACVSIVGVVTACGSNHSSAVVAGGGGGAGGSGTGGASPGGSSGSCDPTFDVSCNGACLLQPGDEGGGCTLLAREPSWGIAVSSGFLYFSAATSIDRIDLASLDLLTLADLPVLPKDVVVDSSAVYFDTEMTEPALGSNQYDGTVRSVAPTGGDFTVLASGLATPLGLTLIGSTLYFGAGSPDLFQLMSEATTATVATRIGYNSLSAFAIDGTMYYYAPEATATRYTTVLSVEALADPLQNSTVATLPVRVTWLSTDATYLYFVGEALDATSSALQTSYGRVTKADGTVETLRTSATPFTVKVADADSVYILERADSGNRVIEMPRGGGTEKTLATFVDTYDVPVAVDSTSVYIGSEKGIVRVAK